MSYHPPAKLRDNVAALRGQVASLVIVDNGSGDASREFLEEIAAALDCHVIFNSTNAGIAAALNLGMTYTAEQRCTFAALFDQDSCVTEFFIRSLLSTYEAYKSEPMQDAKKAGIIVPTYIDERSGMAMPVSRTRRGLVRTAMTSGTLIPLATFARCGPFEEALFIDYVDIEYCLRLGVAGFAIVQSVSATLLHSLGTLRAYSFAGRRFAATHHSASRRYYITRNRILLYRRYLVSRPEWVVRDVWAMAMETVKIVLVEDDCAGKLRATLAGIADAVAGRTGYRAVL